MIELEETLAHIIARALVQNYRRDLTRQSLRADPGGDAPVSASVQAREQDRVA